jgi:hypothetical protein
METRQLKIDESTISIIQNEKHLDAEGELMFEEVTLSTSTRLPKLRIVEIQPCQSDETQQ